MQTDGEFSKRRVEMGHFGGPPPGARVRRWSRLACRCFLRRSLCVQRWPRVVADELAEGMVAAFRADAKHCGSAAGDSRSGVQLRRGRSVILCLGPGAWGLGPGAVRRTMDAVVCLAPRADLWAARHLSRATPHLATTAASGEIGEFRLQRTFRGFWGDCPVISAGLT